MLDLQERRIQLFIFVIGLIALSMTGSYSLNCDLWFEFRGFNFHPAVRSYNQQFKSSGHELNQACKFDNC